MCWRYSNADMKIDMVKELTDWWRRYTGELQVNSVKGTGYCMHFDRDTSPREG